MHNKLLLTIGFCLVVQLITAQTWRMGILALNNGEHIVGEINHDFENNLVQIRYDDKELTFTAFQFYSFRLVKNEVLPERNFYVMNFANRSSDKPVPHLFEGIYKGDVSLLVRAYDGVVTTKHSKSQRQLPNWWNESDFITPSDKFLNKSVRQEQTFYVQFLADQNGRVKRLKGGQKDRIAALGGEKRKLSQFAKRKGLRLKNHFDMALLVEYYHQLKSQTFISNAQ